MHGQPSALPFQPSTQTKSHQIYSNITVNCADRVVIHSNKVVICIVAQFLNQIVTQAADFKIQTAYTEYALHTKYVQTVTILKPLKTSLIL